MFCHSCGKKISSKSVFCKYCGISQKKVITDDKDKTRKYVWICDYCGKESKTKLESDKHELVCLDNPKNKKFYLNSNPKKAWLYLWLTTMLVFAISLYINARFSDFKITLLNGKILLILFLVNICIGVISFLAVAVSGTKSQNNKVSGFIKNILLICLIYLIINPAIFAVEGYRARQDEAYRNKHYNNQILVPTQTPISPDFRNTLTNEINNYRREQKLNEIISDDETCKIAERLINKDNLQDKITEKDYIDLCPKCNQIGFNWADNTPTEKILNNWKDSSKTNDILKEKYKYGCVAIKDQKIIVVFSNKGIQPKSNATSNVGDQNNIECIGPDGKHFNTSMSECKTLNEKWGKPLDYMTNCNYPAECGGGTKRESYSECMKPCIRTSTGSNNPPSTVVITSTQNNSPKVAFQATETSIKGTYYCYENKVNSMVTQQSFVKTYRELYENCKNSSYNANKYSSCCTTNNCYNLTGSEKDTCYTNCYNEAYGTCNEYNTSYYSEQSKLNNMRWDYCP